MGAAGCRFGRNVPLEHTFPDAPNLLIPNPRHVSRELMTRDQFQPATILNLMAASWIQFMVHDWFVHDRSKTERIDIPIGAGDDWGAPSMRGAAVGPRPGARGLDAAARLHQSEQPLVGRVADLRLRRRHGGEAAHPQRRQAPNRADRPAADRSRHRRPFRRLQRQLVDRPGHAPHALHAGAQLHLRSARPRSPGLERRAAVSQGQADQLRRDGQDPHGRVDAGDPPAPDHQAGDERQLVRPRRRGPCRSWPRSSTTASCSAASSARTPIITARRIR